MKHFVLTYDPQARGEPRLREFALDDADAAFAELEAETLKHYLTPGMEVVLFSCESEEMLRKANSRYFPAPLQPLSKEAEALWEQFQRRFESEQAQPHRQMDAAAS